MELEEFLNTFRNQFQKRGHWFSAAELNVLEKDQVHRKFKVLITRLGTYEDTSLSFTHNYIYSLVAQLGFYPDRCFLPPPKDMLLWKEHQIPGLWGIQSHLPAQEFGLVSVSNSVTQEMGNLVWFLKSSGFPLSRGERLGREDLPLVLMGGANAPFASVLDHEDSLVDGIYLGEGRAEIEKFFSTVAQGREIKKTKADILRDLETLPGFYIPGSHKPVEKASWAGGLDSDILATMPVNYGEGNPGKAVMAISRGCAGFCSFCAESFAHKPYQETPLDQMKAQAGKIKAGQGASKLDLFSYNFNMHKDFYPLLEFLAQDFSSLGLKSQRFDSIAADPKIVEVEKIMGKTWFTCGLEGISDRIRSYLNKNLNLAQVKRSLAVLARTGIRELKVFLIATGKESDEDFAEFRGLLEFLRTLPTPSGRPLKTVFSITPLVRFPHTPWERDGYTSLKVVEKIMKEMARHTRELGFESRVAADLTETWVCERLLRPGSSFFFPTWVKTLEADEFVYYDEIPSFFGRHWSLALESAGWGADQEPLWSQDQPLPWERIGLGPSHGFLHRQHQKNSQFQEIHPAQLVREEGQGGARVVENLRRAVGTPREIHGIEVELTHRAAVSGREMAASALAQALMRSHETLTKSYKGSEGSFWSPAGEDFCLIEGRDIFYLVFDPRGREIFHNDPSFWESANVYFKPFGKILGWSGPGKVELRELKIEVQSEFKIDWGTYFFSKGLKHTLVKTSPQGWRFDFTPQALKKEILKKAILSCEGESWKCVLEPGIKFSWKEIHYALFQQTPSRWISL